MPRHDTGKLRVWHMRTQTPRAMLALAALGLVLFPPSWGVIGGLVEAHASEPGVMVVAHTSEVTRVVDVGAAPASGQHHPPKHHGFAPARSEAVPQGGAQIEPLSDAPWTGMRREPNQLQPTATLDVDDAPTFGSYSSRASRTRGQPVTA